VTRPGLSAVRIAISILAIGIHTSTMFADEKLKDIACRSVHLHYPAPEGDAFFNEVKVEKSAEGTYFCVCGFSKGYYGIQELGNGKKLLIFSVWAASRSSTTTGRSARHTASW
jgi:hypothetical protein